MFSGIKIFKFLIHFYLMESFSKTLAPKFLANMCSQGDILFLRMSKDPIRAGEIVVFNVEVGIVLAYLS